MNKRIKELAEQAQDWADAHAPYASEEHEYFVEKFAQLIVKECADVAKETRWAVPPSQEQIARGIQQHFGVEE
jgi:hypothetical protein